MSPAQQRVLDLLKADRKRDLYEGADASGKKGCGLWWVTYSAGVEYRPLTTSEVRQLERSERIELTYPGKEGMYRLKEIRPGRR